MSEPNQIGVHVIGYPHAIGGAGTELWHTVKLWRKAGLDVILHPTGTTPDEADWKPKLDAIGCKTDPTWGFPAHSLIVGFCNRAFRQNAPALRKSGHKLIYVPCMVAPFPEERPEAPIADRYVFQSYFQREKYLPLIGIPPEHGVLIRGAFDASEFQHNPLPHMPGKPFIVGKLCRAYNTDGQPALEKYPADLWAQYARISHPIHARVMGWGPEIEEKCGPPPSWAEVLPQGAETVQQFLESIHCLVPGIGCCLENWPRIGLEASAVGTPVIAENRGGWKNMLSSLAMAATVDEQAWKVAAIAYGHKVYGMSVDWGSRLHQESIARSWLDLFRELAA